MLEGFFVLFLAFLLDSHKHQCLSELVQLGLFCDISVFRGLHSRSIYYGYESFFSRLADPSMKKYISIKWEWTITQG